MLNKSVQKYFLFQKFENAITKILKSINLGLLKSSPSTDFFLYKYKNYEEYKDIQIYFNKMKIDKTWADEQVLSAVAARVRRENLLSGQAGGICHGSRNGFEQRFLSHALGQEVIGTDISDTAEDFPNTWQWDFHDVKEEWIERFDFIYTNSLDQSWQPEIALNVWVDQLRKGGLLFIEHTNFHGPQSANKMDPFGVTPRYFPYLLAKWLGHKVSIEIIKETKLNYGHEVWLFVLKKTF
jgi:hypothetical protein